MSSQPPTSKKKLSDNAYLKYIGLGFQVVAAVVLGITAGYYTDKWCHFSKPYMFITFSFLSIIAACYWIIKQVLDDK